MHHIREQKIIFNKEHKLEIKILKKPDKEVIKQIREVEIICKNHDKTNGNIYLDGSLNFYPELKTLFLLYDDDRLVSLISIFIPTANEAEISAYTLPEYRRKGYFKRLLFKVIEELKKHKGIDLVFVCEPQSGDGKKALEKLGAKLRFTEHFLRYTNSSDNLKGKLHPKIKLHEAGPEDVDKIVSLCKQIFNDNPLDSKSMITKSLKADNIIQYTAILDGDIIGMAAASFNNGEASIFGLGISPQHQGKGFGKELISLILEDLDKRGIRDITIEVDSSNKNAFHLYTKIGFKVEASYGYYGDV